MRSTIKSLIFASLVTSVCSQASFAEQTQASDEALSLHDVLKSTLAHHPKIAQAASIGEQARGRRLETEGAFDWQIEQEGVARTSGFYNGWILDQRMTRTLPYANAKVSGGYRISDGSFPIYEDINNTLSAGEANFDLAFSLLRDREIDSNRAAIINAELSLEIASQQQKLMVNDLLLDATLQYLKWQQSSERRRILERLFKLAKDRQFGIEQKVAAGELARITLTEFQVTLLQREAELLSNEQSLRLDAIGLSFYMRDQQGQPKPIAIKTRADKRLKQNLTQLPDRKELFLALRNHPDVVTLEQEIAQLRAELQLNENDLLPQLDFKIKVANDIGAGSTTLNGLESYVGFDFSVPIGQRAAKGKRNQTQAKLIETSAKHQEIVESLDVKLNQAMTALSNLILLRDLRDEQARVAERLMKEEQARFEAGDSDLFLLNARETNFARAQLAALDAHINLLRQHFIVLAGSAVLDELII
jgi:outer membrane protein TolC